MKCYMWLGRVLTKFMSLYTATFASSFFVAVLCICVLCISVCRGGGNWEDGSVIKHLPQKQEDWSAQSQHPCHYRGLWQLICDQVHWGHYGFPAASCLASRPSHPSLWAPVVVSGRVRYPKSISGLYVLANIHVNEHLDIHVHVHICTHTHKTVKQANKT